LPRLTYGRQAARGRLLAEENLKIARQDSAERVKIATMPNADEPAEGPVEVRLVGRVAGRIEDAVDAVRSAVQATGRQFDELPGARVRRLRRLAREPLPFLYEVHPEARRANPRELGTLTVDVDDIVGTAVGPPRQRGRDFLPLKPFRTLNWHGRWQRVRAASERLAILPPIDVFRYGGKYWVIDGHNRVAAALYNGQIGIDANVVELGPRSGLPGDQGGSLAAEFEEHDEIKAALSRRTLTDPDGRP
jgi:hypothetical protein